LSYFDQYSPIARTAAVNNGLDPAVFFGLIQTESSWNPYAKSNTSSAYGFTQLLGGTAGDLGVNRYDPRQNLAGGAQYLASMPGANITEKLAHYYQGPGATLNASGFNYAKTVLNNAKQYVVQTGSSLKDKALNAGIAAAEAGLNAVLPGLGSALGGAAGALGIGGEQQSWFQQMVSWFVSVSFIQRLALGIFALILIVGGIYLLGRDNPITSTIKSVA
jgi:hypothetical protein